MKYPTVSVLCEGVAGAIREKEGSTALINPQDFVDRIKGLEVGGGIPDVPTLECWKLALTEDNQDAFQEFIMDNFVGDNYHAVLATSKWGIGDDEIIISGGSMLGFSGEWLGVQEIYILWYPNSMMDQIRNIWRERAINAGAEQITLSEWLSITAQAIHYREIND